ncbi:hypothetical protein CVT24_006152 [Panaeolus cyanescens]|uniref:K Homology domain-containing protein n=1 Tax=Panaeolus cyanescens TaxID=181874 RepID=A0A409V8M3_9AGAR|nr:hypothetical protein CVT24_006152 [Panaeolus cyanescens]
MALNAADLQRRHELEGAPDPFPSLSQNQTISAKLKASDNVPLDTDSEIAFPSLAPATPVPSTNAASAWGAAAGPRLKAAVSKAPVFTDSFTMSAIDLSNAGKDGKPTTLGEVIKQVIAKYKVKIEASANQRARQTTFHIKAESEKELDKAKRSLLALLSPVVTVIINAPASCIASIIGPKGNGSCPGKFDQSSNPVEGATLKQIRDQTSVRVDIPKKESIISPGNGHANGHSDSKAGDDGDEEEITVPVTLTGPQPLVYDAQAMLNQIIASKTSKTTQRVRDIPQYILPFVLARRPSFLAAAQDGTINLSLNAAAREITASGDREAVVRVVDAIKQAIESLEGSLTSIKLALPKSKHRLLSGSNADDIMKKSNCTVVAGDSEEVVVWGQPTDLPAGLAAVVEKSNSKHIQDVPLPGPIELSKLVATYLERIHYGKTLKAAHPDVDVFLPSADSSSNTLTVDFVGEKTKVAAAVKQTSELLSKLPSSVRDVSVDWLLHRVIIGKSAKKIKQFQETHSVQLFFPNETAESSHVLLVFDPSSPAAADEKKKHLDDVEKELLKLVKEAANVKTETLSVEKRWHEAVVGKSGTTLNAIIGEDKTLSIKVGAEAGDATTEDVIVIRGVSSDVDRAVKEILQIVEDAKNDEIINSYSTEFDIEREYVGRIVGAQGAGVNRLRDQLGVKVDVSDDIDEKEKEGGKRKKVVHQKSKIKITGRKENVEEAKKRILAQVERLADETSEILKIPAQFHSSLIGQSGKYAIRLEEKYSVKITFPRQSSESGEGKTREQLKADEVLVKGGKKGVAGAKSELLEALEFEKESNNILKFTVPTRSVARILGRGGASINEIKDTTDAQIDIEKGADDITSITVRGTKKAINAAKVAILAIADQVAEETTATVSIESRFHRAIIGAGGQGLKELIARCDGPTDSRLQASLIRFPRQGEPSDEVRIRGEPKLVAKIKSELESIAAKHRDRVILGVQIPAVQHRALIGRGGQHLNEIQEKYDVQIQFPGSRSYGQVGEPENLADLGEVDPATLIKVSGPRAACQKAITDLQSNIKAPPAELVSSTISVPLKYHHAISQQGVFFRNLRGFGVQVEHSIQPQQAAVPTPPASTARIDDEEPAGHEWHIGPNYENCEQGESVWTLKGRDQASLTKAEGLIKDAIESAARKSHVGFLTLPDRSMFPKIVGSKGANVSRLRNETGADITVSRENSTIVIVGTEPEVLAARDAILKMTANPGRRRND